MAARFISASAGVQQRLSGATQVDRILPGIELRQTRLDPRKEHQALDRVVKRRVRWQVLQRLNNSVS
jgi:hypothetical protein